MSCGRCLHEKPSGLHPCALSISARVTALGQWGLTLDPDIGRVVCSGGERDVASGSRVLALAATELVLGRT